MQWPPQSEINGVLLYAVGLPLAVAAVVQFLFLLLGGKPASGVGSAVSLASGFAVGDWQLPELGWPLSPSAHDFLPWVALAALLAGAVAGEGGRPRAAMWLVAISFSFLGLLAPPELRNECWWLTPAIAVAVACNWALADEQARRHPGAIVPIWLALIFLAAAVVLIHAHSKRYMDAAVIAAGALLGLALASCWWSGETGPVAGGASVFLVGLMVSGQTQTFTRTPWIAFLLIALAPLTLGLSLLPPISRLTPWNRLLLQTFFLLAPLIGAVVLAARYDPLDFSF